MDEKPGRNSLESQEYAKLTGFDGKWRENWWRRDFLEFYARRCGLDSVHTLLDVGCGVGHWGRTLSRVLPSDLLVAGIDIEKAFIDRAVEQGKAFGLSRMEYKVGDASSIPYGDNHFDLVTCQTVLIHVKDPVLALKEMKRVLKSGGTLLLAEPNNLIWYFNFLLAEPRPEWATVQKLIDFYHTCLNGKKELGNGDSSIGEKLPYLVSQAGFKSVRVSMNESCATLIPPYEPEEQQIEIQFLKSCITSGAWMGFGPRHNALRFFTAGGGSESAFEAPWDLAISSQQRLLSAIENKTFNGSRGAVMYLIAAKK